MTIEYVGKDESIKDYLPNVENRKILLITGESFLYNTEQYKQINDLHPVETIKVEANAQNRIEPSKSYDMIIAVGGGSVIDMAKELAEDKELLIIPTLFSTGTITNSISVLGSIHRCRVADSVIIDPSLQYNLLPNYTTYSVIAVTARQVLDNISSSSELWTQTLKDTQEIIEKIMRNPMEYDYRRTLIDLSLAIPAVTELTLPETIAIELCRHYRIPYGAALSMVLPAWLKLEKIYREDEILQLETWFHSQGSPIRFSEYNIDDENLPEVLMEKYSEVFQLAM